MKQKKKRGAAPPIAEGTVTGNHVYFRSERRGKKRKMLQRRGRGHRLGERRKEKELGL